MGTYTVSFFGHRQIDNPFQIEHQLENLICDLLRQQEFVEFLVGRDGEFDQLVSSTIRRCKRNIRDDNSALVWVMPYEKAEFQHDEAAFLDYYDEIEVCTEAANKHYKSAFQIRNRSMVNLSHLVVFCVERSSGGAYKTLTYAKKLGANFINLANETH